MDKTVDARGLLCPEPVLLVKREIDKMTGGTVRVLVDNSAARENVTRMAENSGWTVSAAADGIELILTLSR
ncbi:MAG: sulfurtransferase TusA family protein [Actinobacteria bacterium]|nr:sulfurtransferase TusA family protein [Actinomycetota bacterium]